MGTNDDSTLSVVWNLAKRIALIAVMLYVLYRVRTVVISLLIAILLTYALLPAVEWLCRRPIRVLRPKTQRLIATVLVFVAFASVLGLSVGLFVAPFKREVNEFGKNLGEYGAQLSDLARRTATWYDKAVPADVKGLVGKLDYPKIGSWAGDYAQRVVNYTTSWIGIALELVLIPVLAFYFVLDYRSLSREVYGLVPRHRLREAVRIGRDIGQIMQSYIVGQLILCALAGVLTGIVLAALGVPYVVVLALFAGITRAIPVIGPVVSGVPIVLVGMLNFEGSTMALWLLFFVVVMHFAESKFIMPRLIGDRIHLHPATVILVLLIGAEFFGLVGMFLAAPIAAIIRELIRLYYINPRRRAWEEELAARRPQPFIETQSVG